MHEVFKKLEGTPFEISDKGSIKKKGVLYHQATSTARYLELDWQIKGKRHRRFMHRVMAELFIPNPQALPEVHAKDGNYRNIHLNNLEWVTRSEATRGICASELKKKIQELSANLNVKHLDFLGHPGYWVSTNGQVFTFRYRRQIFLSPTVGANGYASVGLSWNQGTAKRYSVHRLVAQAFIPNPERKSHVNHKDMCKTNNVVQNLEWCTIQENNEHARDNKTGYGVPPNIIPDICKQMEQGTSNRDIAEHFDIALHVIIDIKRRKSYTRISKNYTF